MSATLLQKEFMAVYSYGLCQKLIQQFSTHAGEVTRALACWIFSVLKISKVTGNYCETNASLKLVLVLYLFFFV